MNQKCNRSKFTAVRCSFEMLVLHSRILVSILYFESYKFVDSSLKPDDQFTDDTDAQHSAAR